MSSDREMLELAAKAAGLDYLASDGRIICTEPGRAHVLVQWDPLADDGDALRLAVKLAITDLALTVGEYVLQEQRRQVDDVYSITRRAIVRAAAEIGRQMEGGAV